MPQTEAFARTLIDAQLKDQDWKISDGIRLFKRGMWLTQAAELRTTPLPIPRQGLLKVDSGSEVRYASQLPPILQKPAYWNLMRVSRIA